MEKSAVWKTGPLPPDTWAWGGVVPFDVKTGAGFYFADFCGDHVICFPGERRLEAHEVKLYTNCLELPPECSGRAGA